LIVVMNRKNFLTKGPDTHTPIVVQEASRIFANGAGVAEISFRVPAGTIFGLIGPSGCGKTTTVRLLTGIHRPDAGNVQIFGQIPHRFSRRQRKQIGYVAQQFALYERLSVRENLDFAASLQGMRIFGRRRRVQDMLNFVELSDAQDRLAAHLSGGMRRRLMLACALVHEPKIVFADEPTTGIDPVLREKLWEGFRTVRDEGRSIFVTTQYVGEATNCDYVGVMSFGRMLAIDTPTNLRRQALGGDVVRITVSPEQLLPASELLRRHPALRQLRYSTERPGVMDAVVDDAGERLPQILDLLRQAENIEVQSAQPYFPPFDEVFVQMMTKQGDTHA
jgi:ABC-2 type transport system ATP-binding protein